MRALDGRLQRALDKRVCLPAYNRWCFVNISCRCKGVCLHARPAAAGNWRGRAACSNICLARRLRELFHAAHRTADGSHPGA